MKSGAEPRPDAGATRARAAADFRIAWDAAMRARERVLSDMDDVRIVAALAAAAREWTRTESELRRRIAGELSVATGMHPAMLAAGLELVFGAVTVESLAELLRREADTAKRIGPPSVFYALAGNVPWQAIPPIVASLLARSVAIVRDSARQPCVTSAFCESLARIDPDLAAMIVPVAWSSGTRSSDDEALERLVIDRAGRIELFGSDATVTTLSNRYGAASSASLARHTTRISVGVVDTDADLGAAAVGFALDVVLYEGRVCLTPHVLLAEGSPSRADELAARLARHLDLLEQRWPRARGSLAEESARRAFMDRAEVGALAGDTQMLLGSQAAWCVSVDADAGVGPGPGLRCVAVVRSSDRRATLDAIAHASVPLAAVGIATATRESADTLSRSLSSLGATLVVPAGRMQAPPIHWEQDGRRRLAELLEAP